MQPTDQELAKVRAEILALGSASKQTERSLSQQADVLKNLRSQAEIGGALYRKLTSDIDKLKAASQGLSGAGQQGAQGIDKVSNASKTATAALDGQIKMLARLQGSLAKGGEGYRAIGREIDALKAKAASLDLSKLNVPGIAGTVAGRAAGGVTGAIGQIVQLRQELSRSNPGRVALTAEGLATAGLVGTAGAGVAAGIGGVAGGLGGLSGQLDAIASKAAALPSVLRPLGDLLSSPAASAGQAVAQWGSQLAAAQAKLAALSGPFAAIGKAVASVGPESAAALGTASLAIAVIYDTLEKRAKKAKNDLDTSFREISKSANKALQEISSIFDKNPNERIAALQELRNRNLARLGESQPESLDARQAANAVVSAEREIAKIKESQNQLIEQAKDRQNAATAAQRQALDVARRRLEVQRQTTAEIKAERQAYQQDRAIAGSIRRNQERLTRETAAAEPARIAEEAAKEAQRQALDIARQRLEAQRQITAQVLAEKEAYQQSRAIAGSIRRNQERVAREDAAAAPARAAQEAALAAQRQALEVARQRLEVQRQTTAQVRAEREAYAQDRAIAGSIRRNQERVAREQQDLARRASAAYPAPSVLALPAAGQTSFRGMVDARGIGGGARTLSNFETAGTRDVVGTAMGSLPRALQDSKQASDRAKQSLRDLFIEIDRARQASNGSISSLQRQRTAWDALRNAVNPAAPAYEKARRQIELLDNRLKQLSGTQEKVQRQSIGREAIGAAFGTLATGGGLQGAAGALAGGLAFSGGAGGALAGAGITAVAAGGALAARVGVQAETAEVRLRALTDQFGEFNQAQLAATRIAGTLRISQIEAADGLSQLYAALRPTGVTLREIEDAFIGFTAAARVSGSTVAESSAALLQLRQALGSGVLQGDELRSLREQAPLAAQAIAREMGVTIGELKALGSEGKITTDIVLRALATLKNENLGKLNQQFNTSAQALKDLQIATENLGRSIARVFGPTTVEILKSFTDSLQSAVDVFNSLTGDRAADERIQIRIRARQQAERDTNARPFAWWDSGGRQRFFEQRERQLVQQYQRDQPSTAGASNLTQQQRDAQADAARERAAGRERAMQAEGEKARKKADEDREDALKRQFDLEMRLGDIRLQTEKRLAEFREQSLRRAQQLEQDIRDQREQADRRMDRLTFNLRGQEEDRALRAEIQRAREAGMPTEGLELRLSAQQEMRRAITDVDDINNNLQDNYKTLNRSIKQLATDYSEGLRDVVQQGAEATTDALRDAQRQVQQGQVTGGAIRGGAVTSRTRDPDAERTGWDIVHPGGRGAAIRTPVALTITGTGFQGRGAGSTGRGYGNWITGEFQLGGKSYELLIGHFDRIDVAKGMQVPAGTALGTQGITGRTFGTHATTHVNPLRGATVADAWSALDQLTRVWERGGGIAGPAPAPMPPGATATAPAPQLRPQDLAAPNQAQVTAAARGLMDLQGRSARVEGVSILGGLLDNRIANFSENTKELTDQANATRQQLENYQRQQVLIRGGLSPEISKMRVEAERKLETERNYLQVLEQVVIDEMRSKELTDYQKKGYEDLLTRIRDRRSNQLAIVDGMVKEQQQLDRLTQAYEEKRQLVEGIAGSIGEGIAGSIDLLINGTENWGASLREIAAGVLQDIAQQLARIYIVQPATSGLQRLLQNLIGGGRFGAGYFNPTTGLGAAGPNFGFANGGIMTSAGPLPLRAYSAGGIANSPQLALFGEGRRPEAFVPLPDGRRIPVALQGGSQGGSVVNVTVNAQGSAVQGNDNRSERLGRVVAQAIQEEMIRQRRPGGLLSAV